MRRLLSSDEHQELIDYLRFRFGIDSSHFDHFYFERTKRDIFMLPKNVVVHMDLASEKVGLRAFNGEKHPPKPTSSFLQRFGHLATKSFVELNAIELFDFLNGRTVASIATDIENGYTLVRRHGIAVGCGFARDGNLESQFPIKTGRSVSQKFL